MEKKNIPIFKSEFLLKLFIFAIILVVFAGCMTYKYPYTNSDVTYNLTEMTTNQTVLTKGDVAKFFCSNLTEFFNSSKYYRIESKVCFEDGKQNSNSKTIISKKGKIHMVKYEGSSGFYTILFSDTWFDGYDRIGTFDRQTIEGNAIRGKVYDTFSAWTFKQEIALKTNNNSEMFEGELSAALEVENWYNKLSAVDDELRIKLHQHIHDEK